MAKVKQVWFVIPSEFKSDGKEWHGAEQAGNNRDQMGFAEVAPRRDARGNRVAPRNEEEAQVAVDDGFGFGIATADAKGIMAFTTKGKAQEFAKHQASMNPTKLYGVFECSELYETTMPSVVEKQFNDAGELVIVTPGA